MSGKKPYTAPQLYAVELDQEQAILSACSLATTSARNGGNRRCNNIFIPCKNFSLNFGDSGPRPS